MKKYFNLIIKQRFLIAIICFVISVGLELNGSSISNWINFGLKETTSHEVLSYKGIQDFQGKNLLEPWLKTGINKDVLWGIPREIRSDEWNVQTPFYISQSSSGLALTNELYGESGQNMVVAYNSPVKDISIIGKPFNWGFLFLGPAKAISWYWSFKIITMLLLAFEFCIILTNKNKLLSLVSAFWIVFTPAIQWWFMQHLGDVVYFTLLILVGVYHYFNAKKLISKIFLSILVGIGLIGFTLVIYPAFQVPFFYFIVGYTFLMLFEAIKKHRVKKQDFYIIALTVTISFSIIGLTVYHSLDAIQLSLSTVYPGHRISHGGEIEWKQVSDFLLNIMLPYRIPSYANQVELSSSIHYFYIVLVTLPFLWVKKDLKEQKLGILLIISTLLLFFYAIVGIPTLLSKVSLLSYVTSSRAWQAMSVFAVFTSVWFINYLREKTYNRLYLSILSFLPVLYLSYRIFTDSFYDDYTGVKFLIFTLGVYALSMLFLFFKKFVPFYCIIIGFTFFSGVTVNPLVKGIGIIENSSLSHKIEKISKKSPSAVWMSDATNLYNYLAMFDVETIDGVRFYPDTMLMSKIDQKHSFESIWNRYSHLHYNIVPQKTNMSLLAPDSIEIDLNIEKLKELKVEYILTTRPLDTIFTDKFKKVYQGKDGNYIFRYTG